MNDICSSDCINECTPDDDYDEEIEDERDSGCVRGARYQRYCIILRLMNNKDRMTQIALITRSLNVTKEDNDSDDYATYSELNRSSIRVAHFS